MPKRIEVPGEGVIEFPDDMTDAQIEAVLRRQFPAPAKGPGRSEAGLIAAGRGTDKIVQGVKQLFSAATGDRAALEQQASSESEKDRLYAPLKEQYPWITAAGEAAPMLATAPLGGTGFLAGAIPGALSYGSPQERAINAGLGGAGGMVGTALGKGAARLLQPAGPAAQRLAPPVKEAAKRVGRTLTAGEATQNPALVNFENYLAKSPGSSTSMQAQRATAQEAMNKAAAGAMGQSGGDLSEQGFATAKQAIGAEFQRLQEVTHPKLGKEFMQALIQVEADNASRGSFRSASVDAMLDKAIDLAAKNDLTGKAYKEIRTVLTSNADAAFRGGDAIYGGALKTVRKALDDAAKGSLSEADKAAWDATRAQWAAYKALTKSNVSEAGNVSPARLAAGMRRGSDALRTGSVGKGPLADIARLGEAVKGSANPNSGQLNQMMLYGNPVTGLPMMAANKLGQAVYTSRPMQAYLSEGILNLGPAGYRALAQIGTPIGAPPVHSLLGVD